MIKSAIVTIKGRILGIFISGIIPIVSFAQISQIHFGSKHSALNGLTITWQNNVLGDSIKWGYLPKCENGKYVATSRIYHDNFLSDFTFPELLPDTTIYYSLFDASTQLWSEQFAFKTANQNKVPFSFTAMGDSRTNMLEWQMVSNAALPSDFTLFMGDIINNGSNVPDWDSWFNFGKSFLQSNLVFHTLGNHDVGSLDSTSNYTNLFVLPGSQIGNELYYSFNYGNAVFICLSSEKPADTIQYNWLLKTLEENKNIQWKIVWFHKPFFTSPVHEHDMDAYQNTWWKAFDDFGVDLIFNGHTHNYQRTVPINRNVIIDTAVGAYGSCPLNGRCQIVAGAAGAPLYGEGTGWFIKSTYSGLHFVDVKVFDDSIQIKTLTPNYQVIDSFSILKKFKPSILYSDTMVCSGNELTLTGIGAQTYTWNPAIENGIPFVPFESEKYALIASDSYECSDTLSIDIEILPVFAFSDTLTICEGDSVFWHQQYYKNEGVYVALYKAINQCDSIYELNLFINKRPANYEIIGDTLVMAGSEVFYQVPYVLGLNYFWKVNGGTITDQIFNNVIKIRWDSIETGQIISYAMDTKGCLSNTIIQHIHIQTPISLLSISDDYSILFPNPVHNSLTVNYTKPFILKIYSLQGVEILSTNHSVVDVSCLKTGLYLILLRTEENELIHFGKVIKD